MELVKMESLERVPIQGDWYPYKKGEIWAQTHAYRENVIRR